MTKNIPELYGSMVFSDKVMKNKLPKDVYKSLRRTIQQGTHLDKDVANAVAVAMKEWAVENGATHFTVSSLLWETVKSTWISQARN